MHDAPALIQTISRRFLLQLIILLSPRANDQMKDLVLYIYSIYTHARTHSKYPFDGLAKKSILANEKVKSRI